MNNNIDNFENSFPSSFKKGLSEHYNRLDNDHGRLRSELLARLPETVCNSDKSISTKQRSTILFASHNTRFTRLIRSAVAAAAALAILFGAAVLMDNSPVDSTMAWANAIDNVDRVQTIHFVYTTHPGSAHGSSSIEIWWQRPGNYRMEMSNGVIYSFDGMHRYEYSPKTQKVKISDGQGPEVIFLNELGDFGQMFQSDNNLTFSRDMIESSKATQTENVSYKGEKCYKVTSEKSSIGSDDRIFEYIVDKKVSQNETPILYEVKQFWDNGDGKMTYKALTEVVKIDGLMSDDLFTVDSNGTLIGKHKHKHKHKHKYKY